MALPLNESSMAMAAAARMISRVFILGSVARVRSDRFEVAGVEADPYGEAEELCDRIGNR